MIYWGEKPIAILEPLNNCPIPLVIIQQSKLTLEFEQIEQF